MTRFDVEVSLALGADITADPDTWAWTDITDYTMVRDGGVKIRRGRFDRQSTVSPMTCELLLNNADGRFSRLNPTGAYYGQLSKNTPVRVQACATGGTPVTRFVGFAAEWPPTWDPSERHHWVPVRADGVLRRVGRASAGSMSALRRAITMTTLATTLVGYWPMEDGSDAGIAGSALPAGQPLTVSGDVNFSTSTGPPGSGPLCGELTADQGSLLVPDVVPAGTQDWTIAFVFSADVAESGILVEWYDPTDATTPYWTIEYSEEGDSVIVSAYDDIGALTIAGSDNLILPNEWHTVIWRQRSTGVRTLTVDGVSEDTSGDDNGVSGPPRNMAIAPYRPDILPTPGSIALGHFAVWSDSTTDLGDLHDAMLGYAGEEAHTRLARLLTEESVYGTTGATYSTEMGAQPVGRFLDLARDCETADEAVLFEGLDGALVFQSPSERYNAAAALALDYDLGHVAPPFRPSDDDRGIINDCTVTRTGGASARFERTDGPNGTDPETGVGRYSESPTLNLYQDSQAIDHASWRVHAGTVDEYRYPDVFLKFHRTSTASLLTDWLACDIGSRITIDNMPANMPADLVDQVLEGYTEQINQMEWHVGLNLSPFKPFEVFELAETAADANEWSGRVAEDLAAALRVAVDTDDTSIVFDPNFYRWTTGPDDGLALPGTSGNYASTPDAAALDITGDLDIRVDATLDAWVSGTPSGANDYLVGKYDSSTNQRSYVLRLSSAGTLQFLWSTDGVTPITKSATAAPEPVSGRLAVRATLDVDNGAAGSTVTFYTAPTIDGSWTQLGDPVVTAGVTSVHSGTAALAVGAIDAGTAGLPPGVFHAAEVRTGIAGSEVANPDFTAQPAGTTSFVDDAGLTWTVHGTATIGGDFPLDVRLGGEECEVSAIATTAAAYVAVGAASHADNAAVTPALYAGHAERDLICVLARIRGTAGSLATPTGYTLMEQTGNLYLFGKVHDGSESDPTLTPAGGAAGDTVSAFTFGLRGTPATLDDLGDMVITSVGQSNASAQDIAYGGVYPWLQEGCVILLLAGKSDDWTSVAVPSGFTEIAEPDTTTGSDQGLYAAYAIQTVPAVVNEGSLVVTGGAAAVSESMVLALAGGYQTMTVTTRSVNGVTKSHAAGTRIEVEDAYWLAL